MERNYQVLTLETLAHIRPLFRGSIRKPSQQFEQREHYEIN
jgi:hypothetical protein